jgi:heme/copper-type cytochrome/quinol oxidase subunit 2
MIEFLAQTPGTYTFKCCHTCGLGHRGMKGQIIVEQ